MRLQLLVTHTPPLCSMLPACSCCCPLQEVGWFDEERNSSGVLTSKLSSDALAIKGQFGDTMGLLTQVGGWESVGRLVGWGTDFGVAPVGHGS